MRAACRATHGLAPATESAPAGSRMLRVSSNTSLIAAQMASVSTRIISSTHFRARRKVSFPHGAHRDPVGEQPDVRQRDPPPGASERAMASESVGCTPITRTSGCSCFT